MKKILIAASLFTAFLATPASAEGYMGAGFGRSDSDRQDNSWQVYGGLQFTPTWGLELGYNDLGKYRGEDLRSVTLAMNGTLPVSDHWSVVGKLGAAGNRTKFHGSSDHTDLLLGLGLQYSMSKNVDLRLMYEDFGKVTKADGYSNTNGSNLALSVKYNF